MRRQCDYVEFVSERMRNHQWEVERSISSGSGGPPGTFTRQAGGSNVPAEVVADTRHDWSWVPCTTLAPRGTGTPRDSQVLSVTTTSLVRPLTSTFRSALQGEGRGFESLSAHR